MHLKKFSDLSLLAITLVLSLSVAAQTGPHDRKSYKLTNGKWFDGKRFTSQEYYSSGGLLTKKKPRGFIETLDLKGGFVVPPFAEAHNHNLAGGIYFNRDSNEKMIQRYLANGVFYVKIPSNPLENALVLRRELVNRPDSVDAIFANSALTSGDGHPIGMILNSFKQAKLEPPSINELEGKVFFTVDSQSDLRAKWEKVLEGKPDFIKTILVHSEDLVRRRHDPSLFGYNGLNPDLLPLIVKVARSAGLRVSTHVNSAADFEVAVRAGVDEINHLPGYNIEVGKDERDYLIAPEVAKLAARQDVTVVTTAGVSRFYAKGDALEKIQAVQRKNLQLLRKNGVRLAVGSDNYLDTSLEEVMYLRSLDIFSNTELLNMWTVVATQTVFPNRRVGRLQEGYEASFIVLRANPQVNLEFVKDIQLRMKQGHQLPH